MNNPETLITENGFYAATVHGKSMEPLLRNHHDIVYIEKASILRRRDVVLYRRQNGQLVLHRLIRCGDGKYLACGDNECRPEEIDHAQIIGVMTAFTRNGRTVYTTSKRYRLYSRVWNFSLPTKRLLRGMYRCLRRTSGGERNG